MIFMVAASVVISVFMLGAALGMRQSRLEYEPLLESLLDVSNLLAKYLELTRAALIEAKAAPDKE